MTRERKGVYILVSLFVPEAHLFHSIMPPLHYRAICESRSILFPHSPALDCDDEDDPRHHESDEAHRDGEDEHGVYIVEFHRANYV